MALFQGSTRTRQDFSKIQIEKLEDAWQKGLTSTSKDHAAEIDVLSNETSISRERIEVWIGNRRAKQKRGGQGVRPTKKRKTVKAPTAYSLFSQQFKRGDTPKEEHLRSLGEKWGRTSEEKKMEFRIKAKEIRDDPLKGRTAEEIAEVHLNTITNSCAVLQSLGYEIAAIAAKESEPSHLFGTPRGLEFVKGMQFQKGFRESVFRHIVYVGDDRTHKDTKRELTENVRKIFNSCWASASLKNQAVPYGNIIKNNLYRMEGLPDGVIFKDPNSYGLSTLRQIISQKDSIKFVNVIPATTLASSATPSNGLENEIITEDTDAPAIPLELREEPMEAVADAVDITIGVSGTLAHAVSSDAVGEHGVEVLTDLSNMHMEEITGAPEIPLDVLDSLAATIQVDVVEEQTRIIVPKDEEEENGMFKVVSVLAKKKIGRKQFFLVHWEGYKSSEATWEPRKNIPNYFIKCFNKNQTKKSK